MSENRIRWTPGRVLVHAFLVLFTFATVYPILQIVTVSLRPNDQLYSTSLALIPEGATLEAYRVMLFEKPFLRWLLNSFVVSAAVTVFGVVLASTAAYALSRFRFRGRQAVLSTFLLTQMFPATMTMLPLYVMLRALGLLDQFAGLALAYTATALPFCVWTMRGYYETIPVELEQAALLDGCTPWQAFTKVTLPLAAPALAITALFSFMAAWSEFMVARIVISRQSLYTLPLGLESLAGQFQTEWANYAAGSLIVCVPVMVLFVVLNRAIVSGLSLGSVKG
ncbi:MAG: Trehalose transport system permease protein SugB [Candidatus Eisenbacteria bacterium]|jgi:arabinogalactan oligomer / maltooligosaccharide transport system permease protein